jgi:YD repeat-containing protein
MKIRFTRILFLLTFLTAHDLIAQNFYNYEDFLADSAFIQRHNIKVLSIRVPELQSDPTREHLASQRLCFNPQGKMSWYEHDSVKNNVVRRYYTWHFYDEQSRLFKSRVFQKGNNGVDSIREEVKYHFSPEGKMYEEYHTLIYTGSYHEWYLVYEWQGDSVRICSNEEDYQDTSYYNNKGLVTQFVKDGWKYTVEYNEQGKKSKMSYYQYDETTSKGEQLIDIFNYEYDDNGWLSKIVGTQNEVVYIYNATGLLQSSKIVKRSTGEKVGWEIFYEYEFRDGSFSNAFTKSN